MVLLFHQIIVHVVKFMQVDAKGNMSLGNRACEILPPQLIPPLVIVDGIFGYRWQNGLVVSRLRTVDARYYQNLTYNLLYFLIHLLEAIESPALLAAAAAASSSCLI